METRAQKSQRRGNSNNKSHGLLLTGSLELQTGLVELLDTNNEGEDGV